MQPIDPQIFPAGPGSYALALQLDHPHILQAGQLEEIRLLPGFFIYLGSAWGPGGLQARLKHHLNNQGPLRWHIDYLRRITRVRAVFTLSGRSGLRAPELTPSLRVECLWSQALANLEGASIPMPGFGASDCRSGCPAHLVRAEVVPARLPEILLQAAGANRQNLQAWFAEG